MDIWMDQVLRYSRRDQLSVNYAIRTAGLRVNAITIDNFQSDYHSWPVETSRKWGLRPSRFQEAMRSARADVGGLRNQVDELEAKMNDLVLDRERRIASTADEAARLRQELDQLKASASWRATALLRKVRSRFH
jgi:hypothetical protein